MHVLSSSSNSFPQRSNMRNNFQESGSSMHKKSRPTRQVNIEDDDEFDPKKTVAEKKLSLANLRIMFPNLRKKGLLDNEDMKSLAYLSMGHLAQLDLQHKEKAFTAPRAIEDQLRRNASLVLVDTVYEEEVDNLVDKFHAIRWKRAPTTSSKVLFMEASRQMDHMQE